MSSLDDTFLKLLTTSPIIFGVGHLLLDRRQVNNGHGFDIYSLNQKEGKKKNERNEVEKKDRTEAADEKSMERER
jgi:hypothetical protein